MTTFTTVVVLTVAASSAVGACRRIEQRDPTGIITVDTVARWWGDYARDLRGGDPATVAGWFSDSALFLEPAVAEIAGRPAIEQMLRGALAQGVIEEMRIRPREMTAMGARLFEWGTFTERYRPHGDSLAERRGRYMAEWRRPRGEGEQPWRIHRLLVSEGPPADSAAATAP